MTKRVWITGASEGIGLAIGLKFAETGAAVAFCGRSPERFVRAEQLLRDAGAQHAEGIQADVSTKDGVATFIQRAHEALGGCDILINNAGGGGPGGLLELDDASFEQDWAYAVGVNLMAPARAVRGAIEPLKRSKGVVINISSVWSMQPMDITPPSYASTKAGLNLLTRMMARELGPMGIRVVGVAPGPIWTETWTRNVQRTAQEEGRPEAEVKEELVADVAATVELGRPGQPTEVAEAVFFLASEQTSFISGTTLSVDGGFSNLNAGH